MRRVSILILLAGLMFLAGCSWGRPGNTSPQLPISISLITSGDARTIFLGKTVTVMATVYDQNNQAVTWSVSPLNFGTLGTPTVASQTSTGQTSSSVTYSAPTDFTTPTLVTITATSITNPSVASSVQLSASPTTISLIPPSAQTANQGGEVFLISMVNNAQTGKGVSWSLSPATGAGSLTSALPGSVTYVAPTTVTGPTTVSVTATAVENSAVTASVSITVLPSGGGFNAVAINVDGGPVPDQVYANGAFTSVTICNPGSTSACQTVDGILVDTGSYGLRILQSQIPLLKLTKVVDGAGNTLQNCSATVDGSYLWGPVSRADIYIGGEAAPGVAMQIISNSSSRVPDSCSNGGTDENTAQLLGANGILGVGPEPTDCIVAGVNYCDGSTQPIPPNLYYTCPSTGCAATDAAIIVPQGQQVENPVPLFNIGNVDSNGVILQFPPVSGTEASVAGLMIFGIGTETNNQLGTETVVTLDSSDNFTTIYKGQTLTRSFIDSGSNALYFPDTVPLCASSLQFFCPSSLDVLFAVNQGATQGQSTITFSLDNADNLFSTNPGDAVFPTLGGSEGTFNSCSLGNSSCTFDWGLPFFYGRSVYVAIDGQSVPAPAPKAPWWAY